MNLSPETGVKANVRITTPRNSEKSLELSASPEKSTIISGRQLLELMKNRHFFNKKTYDGIVIVIDELSGTEAGSLRINIRFGMARTVTFTLGWKNRQADICIGDDCFRIELV